MPIAHPMPTVATVKELYGTALVCGFDGCDEPLFKENPGGQGRSLNSRVAHIAARSEGGPRWDPAMSETDNRSAANLILMCVRHADEIDQPGWQKRFPTDLLRRWKDEQVAAYDAALGGWQLSDEEVAEVMRASSIESTIVLQAGIITVGGTGGSAPGASGGGGGAIGPGALGGPGGPVGRVDLDGTPGEAPGAGGGGAGTLARGAILRDPNARQATEGKGFSLGVDGQDGGDTSFTGDTVLVQARGGRRGLAETGNRVTSDRLAVSALMLAEYVEANGLVYVARGSWSNYSVLNLPTQATLPVLLVIEAGGVPPGEYTVALEAVGPDGIHRSRMSFPVTVEEAGDILRISRSCGLAITFDAFGLWTIVATTPLAELARLDLLVKRRGEAE